jgi:hypothetical protein
MGRIEIGIADLILRPATVRKSKFRRRPLARSAAGRFWNKQADRTGAYVAALLLTAPLRLRLEARRERHERLLGQKLRQLATKAVDFRFETVLISP